MSGTVSVPDAYAATQAALAGHPTPHTAGTLTLPAHAPPATAVQAVTGAVSDVAGSAAGVLTNAQNAVSEAFQAPWAFATATVTEGADAAKKAIILQGVVFAALAAVTVALLVKPPKALKKWI